MLPSFAVTATGVEGVADRGEPASWRNDRVSVPGRDAWRALMLQGWGGLWVVVSWGAAGGLGLSIEVGLPLRGLLLRGLLLALMLQVAWHDAESWAAAAAAAAAVVSAACSNLQASLPPAAPGLSNAVRWDELVAALTARPSAPGAGPELMHSCMAAPSS